MLVETTPEEYERLTGRKPPTLAQMSGLHYCIFERLVKYDMPIDLTTLDYDTARYLIKKGNDQFSGKGE